MINNLGDMLDVLAGASGALSELAVAQPGIIQDPNYVLLKRNIERSINFLLQSDVRYMTPAETREFNEQLQALRNGGA